MQNMEQFSNNLFKGYEPKDFQSPGVASKVKNQGKDIPLLFTPLTIKNVTFKNRIAVSPMCQYSCNTDGLMNDWHLVHTGAFAKGGAGFIMLEASAVCPNGRISPMDSGLWGDQHIFPLRRIVNFIHQFDCKVGIQIAHAGRKASTNPPFTMDGRGNAPPSRFGWRNIDGPSSIPYYQDGLVPHEMTLNEIQEVIVQFREAARRCNTVGFDVLEIHGAHGYLISSFLSTTSNKRTDHYGGSFEGRIKILVDIVNQVKQVWDGVLFVRISCEEWVEDGWHVEDTVKLARVLQSMDVDLLDCSSGANSADQLIQTKPLYQVQFADAVKKDKEIKTLKTAAVGLIETAEEAESILKDNSADLIMMARPFLRDPFWPIHAAEEMGVHVDFCLQYELAQKRHHHHGPGTSQF